MASGDARAIPIKNIALRITFPLLDADGDLVTGATALDSEISKDGGTFADCTNEATEIATASGMYYLDLTAAEMNADTVAIIVKTTTSGAKTTPIVLYTTAESFDGAISVIMNLGALMLEEASVNDAAATTTSFVTTLVRTQDDSYVGAILRFTTGSPHNMLCRTIVDYVGATKTVHVWPALPSAPANGLTFTIFAGPTAIPDTGLRAASFNASAIDAAAIATDAVNEIADGVLSRAISNVEGTAAFRTLAGAIAKLVNKVAIAGATLTVYKTDDATAMGTQAVTTDAAADPITAVDTA